MAKLIVPFVPADPRYCPAGTKSNKRSVEALYKNKRIVVRKSCC